MLRSARGGCPQRFQVGHYGLDLVLGKPGIGHGLIKPDIITRADFLSAVAGSLIGVSGYSGGDNKLRRAVLAALAKIAWQPIGLNIRVKDGVVLLRGVISGENAHRAVIMTCENVPGVGRVDDQLYLQSARPTLRTNTAGMISYRSQWSRPR